MAESALEMPTSIPDNDLTLIHAIAAGDAAALDLLYQRHGLALLNYLVRSLDDRLLAEEVLQDVMLVVWRQARDFRGDSLVRTWLFAITRRQMLKALRDRRPTTSALDEQIAVSEMPPSEKMLENTARQQMVQTAIGRLPLDQQQALELVFYRGLSGQEAADQLDIPLNTLKSRLFRARQTLRYLLDPEDIHHD